MRIESRGRDWKGKCFLLLYFVFTISAVVGTLPEMSDRSFFFCFQNLPTFPPLLFFSKRYWFAFYALQFCFTTFAPLFLPFPLVY